jgi:hypothetical protein
MVSKSVFENPSLSFGSALSSFSKRPKIEDDDEDEDDDDSDEGIFKKGSNGD